MIDTRVHYAVTSVVPKPMWPAMYTYIVDGKPVKICRVTLHQFTLERDDIFSKFDPETGSVDFNEFMIDWLLSEAGQWAIENSIERPWYEHSYDPALDCNQVVVRARLTESNLVFFKLRFT